MHIRKATLSDVNRPLRATVQTSNLNHGINIQGDAWLSVKLFNPPLPLRC